MGWTALHFTLYISTDGQFRWLIINGEKNVFLPLNPEGKIQESNNL
jgi:hypothetical protein